MSARDHTLRLTARQVQVLLYLRVFFAANHCLPPCAQTAHDFGWKSPNAANEIMLMLEQNGALTRNELGGYMFTPAGLTQPLPEPGAL